MRRLLGSRPVRLLGLIGIGALAILAATAAPAFAHATVVGTSPGQSANYPAATPPKVVTVTFDEGVTTTPKSIGVYDGAGHAVAVVPVESTNEKVVAAKLPATLAQGNYAVVWHIVSDDGHPETGAFTFSVGTATGAAADLRSLEASRTSSRGMGVAFGLVRGLEYFACMALVGALIFLRWRWGNALGRRDVRRFLLMVAGVGVLTALASISLQAGYSNGSGTSALVNGSALREVVDARYGAAALIRAGLVAALAAYVFVPLTQTRRSTRIAVEAPLALVGVGVAATFAYAGHGYTGRWPVVGFVLDTTHVAAASLWLGGLVLFATALRRQLDPRDSVRALGRFSQIALPAIGVAIIAGAVQGWRQVGTWSALWHTSYGRLLVLKVLVVVALVVIASATRDTLRDRRLADDSDKDAPVGGGGTFFDGASPTAGARAGALAPVSLDASPAVDLLDMPADPDDQLSRELRTGILVEVGLSAVVLAITSALVVSPPSREAEAAAHIPQAQTAHLATQGKIIGYAVAMQPTLAGENTIVVNPHLNSAGMLPTTLTGQAHVAGATKSIPLTFTALANGEWVAVAPMTTKGLWTVTLDGSTPPESESASFTITIR
jgi:copper transport protein